MRNSWKRLVSALLAMVLLAALLPLGGAFAAGRYGKTTSDSVAIRKSASTSGDIWFRVDKGTVATVLSTEEIKDVTWYKVQLEKPGSSTGNVYVGYVHGDYFVPLTDTEAVSWENNPVNTFTATAADGTVTTSASNGNGVGTITNGGVNFREQPSLRGGVIMQLDRGTTVELLFIPAASDPDPWYQVWYGGFTGYVQGPFVKVVSTGNLTPGAVSTASPVAVPVTQAPGITAAPATVTQAPAATQTPAAQAPVSDTYAKLLLSAADLYQYPGSNVINQWKGTGSTLPVYGTATMYDGYAWYPVIFEGTICYVRGDAISLTAKPTSVAPVTPTPSPAPAPGTQVNPAGTTAAPDNTLGYVITTKGGVNLRLKPAGNTVQQVRRGLVVPYQAAPVSQDNYLWYYVQVDNVHGWLRGDCVALCDAQGKLLSAQDAATPVPQATATPAAAAAASGYVRTIADYVNLRNKPAGLSLEQIRINKVLPLTGAPQVNGRYAWYPVKAASGRSGWLRSDCIEVTDAAGATPVPGTTLAPVAAVTATPAPNVVYGYIQVTKNAVNLRKKAAGATIAQVDKDTVWPLTGAPVKSSGYTWYPVQVKTQRGFIRGDCAYQLSDTQVAAYLAGQNIPVETATPVPTAAPEPVKVVQTVLTGVFLRKSASKDAQAAAQVNMGTVMTYSATTTVGGSIWYNVTWNSQRLWVLGSCVKVLTAEEYTAWQAAHPDATAQPAVTAAVTYVKTIKGGVNVRVKPAGGTLGQVSRGVVMTYSQTSKSGNYTWYKVVSTLGSGWIRGDCVEECQADGSPLPSTIITPTYNPDGTVVSSSATEASYSILKLGSTGNAVTNLTQALKTQGFYDGQVTSSYTTAVEDAVRAFQKAKGLSVDGIAGSNTQHALYGTVPVGTSAASGDYSMVLYPAEKIDWYTGGIQELWPRGANVKVYDVNTGVVWWAHRWAGAYHADIEPLTAADTARLCHIYGVSKASEIKSKNLWQRRPCLVTIGNRTFACALYGIPHGQGEISNNNFPGQCCMHFTNSRTHNGKTVNSYHTQAIQYAWENAPNGHK